MKKAVVSLGVAAGLLLTGFVAIPADAFGSASGAGAVETDIDIPVGVSYITDIKAMPDGELVLIGGNQFDKTLIQYVSEDEGETWQKECEYLSKLPLDLSDAEAVDGYGWISDDGYVGISVTTYEKYLQHVTDENEDELGEEHYAYVIDPDGNVTEVVRPTTEEYGGYHQAYFVGEKMYFDDIRNNMYEVDRDSGALIGRVMEDTDLYFAEAVVNGDELCAVTEPELGYPIGSPFPKGVDPETWGVSGDWQNYTFAVDAVKGEADKYYVADLDGISFCSETDGRQLIYKNSGAEINEYSHFYDMTVIDDDTVIVHSWNEKTEKESLIKYDLQK